MMEGSRSSWLIEFPLCTIKEKLKAKLFSLPRHVANFILLITGSRIKILFFSVEITH